MSEKHLSSRFDTDLTTINTKVLQMGGLAEAQIICAIRTLVNSDTAMYDQMFAVEQEINTLGIEINDGCNNITTRCQLTTRDLCSVVAISKTITNLERIDGEAIEIAKRTKRLMQGPSVHALNCVGVNRSGEVAAAILRHAFDTLVYLDTTATVPVLQENRAVDEEFRGFIREFIAYMTGNPCVVSVALDLPLIMKAIEHIDDHVKNIAEFIICIAKGTDIRHAGREAPKREILGEGEQEGRTGDVSMPSSILVIEGEPAVAELIAVNLQHAGHHPIHVYSAGQALSLMSNVLPGLVPLDWMLPGKSGTMFAKELRANERTHQIPIITLTIHSEEQDKIMGLDSGAGDYVTKPLSLKELLVRVRAVLRRRTPQLTDDVMIINSLRLDPVTHHITATNVEAENPIKLDFEPTEFRPLYFLVTHPERMHSHSQLLDQAWGDHALVGERTVDIRIKRLRVALAPSGYSNIIEAVRGSGYRFARNPGQQRNNASAR